MSRGAVLSSPVRKLMRRLWCVVVIGCCLLYAVAVADAQPPVVDAVFPAGGQAGQTVALTVAGSGLASLATLRCSAAGASCESVGDGTFRLTLPADTPPGLYDLWGIGSNGVSAPRTFVVGMRSEFLEAEPNDATAAATPVPLDAVVNGRIEQAGDVDQFRFEARRGQRVLIECWAERIDSRLRGVLEVFDASGRRIAVNRGYFGLDPLIAFVPPEDGAYVARLHDLIASGGPDFGYRLAVDTGPRVAFTVPNVVPCGTPARIAVYGWNLPGTTTTAGEFDRLDVEMPAAAEAEWPLPVGLSPPQTILTDTSVAYRFPDSPVPVLIGLSDAPVLIDGNNNHSPSTARDVSVPSDVSGQLVAGEETDWYAVQVQRGEVLWVEAFGERIGSPVDLQLSVCDGSGVELAQFEDDVRNAGGAFPTSHLDPCGRWVCPADGRYLIAVRNLIGGLSSDPRRTYRLGVRREEPDFHVVAVPQGSASAGLNVPRGGRTLVDLLAFRERGMTEGIRVTAGGLPAGFACPDVWLGPGVDCGLLVVSAEPNVTGDLAELKLTAVADGDSAPHPVRCGTIVRGGTPTGWGRLVSQMPLAVAGDAPLRVTATIEPTLDHHLYGELAVQHFPGSIVDVLVEIERRDASHAAPVRLIGAGLPDAIENQSAVIPAGERRGYLSFYLPPDLPTGAFSLVIQAETSVKLADGSTPTVQAASNVATFHVKRSGFHVAIDPFAVRRVRRGETFQIAYTATRTNGFIGKLHTELAAPGVVTDVVGLRGRGETFTGQTDHGSLQITVNDDAPLGPQPFLRLLTVGVVEDQPMFLGSCWFPLEIVE